VSVSSLCVYLSLCVSLWDMRSVLLQAEPANTKVATTSLSLGRELAPQPWAGLQQLRRMGPGPEGLQKVVPLLPSVKGIDFQK